MSAALTCPWCGAVLTEQPETCPQCGAVLVERDGTPKSDVASDSVVPVDPDLGDLAPSVGQQLTTSPDPGATSRTAPARAVLGQVIGADPKLAEAIGTSPFSPEEADEGVGFPSDDVRREMLRMQLDAERASLEADATEYEYTVRAGAEPEPQAPAGDAASGPTDQEGSAEGGSAARAADARPDPGARD